MDEFRLKITIHSVQIDIPQSIKMVVQTVYKNQTQQTSQKCKLSVVQAVKMSDQTEQTDFKIADFKNQELYLNVKVDSNIQYISEHLSKMEHLPKLKPNEVEQKCSIKLMAVSEDKSKLIGIVNYSFYPRDKAFEVLKRHTLRFTKSIDNNSSICISSELQPIKVFT